MTAYALLAAQVAKRSDPRYIFRRRGLMTAGVATIQIRTLDVSTKGFGVIANEPVAIGKLCTIVLQAVIGERVVELNFSCTAVYCILAGIDGFRIGLLIDDTVNTHKQQLQKILSTCSSPAI